MPKNRLAAVLFTGFARQASCLAEVLHLPNQAFCRLPRFWSVAMVSAGRLPRLLPTSHCQPAHYTNYRPCPPGPPWLPWVPLCPPGQILPWPSRPPGCPGMPKRPLGSHKHRRPEAARTLKKRPEFILTCLILTGQEVPNTISNTKFIRV